MDALCGRAVEWTGVLRSHVTAGNKSSQHQERRFGHRCVSPTLLLKARGNERSPRTVVSQTIVTCVTNAWGFLKAPKLLLELKQAWKIWRHLTQVARSNPRFPPPPRENDTHCGCCGTTATAGMLGPENQKVHVRLPLFSTPGFCGGSRHPRQDQCYQ